MHLFITISLCIIIAFLFNIIAKKIRISIMVSSILAGLFISLPLIKDVVLGSNTSYILELGEIGLIAIMFLAGLEISWTMFYKEKNRAIYIAIFAFTTSFLLGFFMCLLMGFSLLISLVTGICMSITAEATTAEVLIEMKKLKTRIAASMLGAGIFDDIIGLVFFGLVVFLFKGIVITKEFTTLLIAIFSFFAGNFVHKFVGREKQIIKYFERFILMFIAPFFFIAMGVYFNFQTLILNPVLILIIILIGIFGKIFGTVLTKPFINLNLRQLYMIGWGMNARGAVGLAIAYVAFTMKLINVHIYSGIVIMSLITTFIFPFFLRYLIRHYSKIMK